MTEPSISVGQCLKTKRGTTFEVHHMRRHARGWQVIGVESTRRDLLPRQQTIQRMAYLALCRLCGVAR